MPGVPKDALDRLATLLSRRKVPLELEEALARRVEAYRKRLMEQEPELGDVTFNEALTGALEEGLEALEAQAGVVGTLWGEVVPDTPDRRARARAFLDRHRARE